MGRVFILEKKFPKFRGQYWLGSIELLSYYNLTVGLSFVPAKKSLFQNLSHFLYKGTFLKRETSNDKNTTESKA